MKETSLSRTKLLSMGWAVKLQMTGRMILAIIFGAAAGQKTCAGSAYLPCVGPPMLRFEIVPTTNIVSSANLFTPEMVKDKSVAIPPIEPTPNTNNITSIAASLNATNSPNSVSHPLVSMPAATDDSVVTPQMLVDYLKPAGRGSVMVPINVGFTPPAPTVIEPSKAVYKSE